jgi:hypothetical protein
MRMRIAQEPGADLPKGTLGNNNQKETIGFAVRLTQDDFDQVTRAWRFPVIELPGASIAEIYADGERVDPEKYRIVRNQLRWVSDNLPARITAFVVVDSESRDEIIQSRARAKQNEDWWRKFAITVPLITAALAAAVSLYVGRDKHASELVRVPPATQTLTDQPSREFMAKAVEILTSLDDPLAKAASNIINSCPGGSSGQTPANGSRTMSLINDARSTITQLKAQADLLTREQAPK